MKISVIRTMLAKKPFRKFGIRTTDGSVLEVLHPEYVSLSPEGEKDEIVLVYRQGGGFELIEPGAITKLQTAAKA